MPESPPDRAVGSPQYWSLAQSRHGVACGAQSARDRAEPGRQSASQSTSAGGGTSAGPGGHRGGERGGGRGAASAGIVWVVDEGVGLYLVIWPWFRKSGQRRLSGLRRLEALGLSVKEWFLNHRSFALTSGFDLGLGSLQRGLRRHY